MAGENGSASMPRPASENGYLRDHVGLLLSSYRHWLKRDLPLPMQSGLSQAEALFAADFALVSHGVEVDPFFNYGNGTALRLFELEWESFVRLPSRTSAEMNDRRARARLLDAVYSQGYVDDYAGVRISASGRRFRIERAVVWNLIDERGCFRGQAACFNHWIFL